MSSSVFAAPSPGWFLPPFPNARRPRLASSNLSCRRYTELYQKYQGLFEEKLESFLKTKNCNSDEFMKACQEVSTPKRVQDPNFFRYTRVPSLLTRLPPPLLRRPRRVRRRTTTLPFSPFYSPSWITGPLYK